MEGPDRQFLEQSLHPLASDIIVSARMLLTMPGSLLRAVSSAIWTQWGV